MNPKIKEAQREAELTRERANFRGDQVAPLDPDLAKKIKRVGEAAGEVVKHIEERTRPTTR